jgi:RNA polymerase sigma-70 factor (ECF subfamily)
MTGRIIAGTKIVMETGENTRGSFDEAAFEQLFRTRFKGLCHFALTYVKDMETARGIVQDAFISLWEKRETIDPAKPVHTYLSTAVRNKALNHLRDTKKFSTGLLAVELLAEEPEQGQGDRLVEAEMKARIDEAIGELPEKCREVFVMNRYEHRKYQEIADMLGISVKTVETQMSKALQHMRGRLKEFLPALLLLLIN